MACLRRSSDEGLIQGPWIKLCLGYIYLLYQLPYNKLLVGMMKNIAVMAEFFGNYPIIKVMDFLLENRGFDYSKVEIVENAGIGIATLHLLWEKLEKFGVVKETRKYGNTKLYMLNEENEFVKMLKTMILKLAKEDFEKNIKKTCLILYIY